MNNSLVELPNDGERLIPELHQGILDYGSHMNRYVAIEEICAGKTVLDIASGSGYGTAMIAKTAKNVIGVDISDEAVEYATQHYGTDNIEFRVGSCSKIPVEDQSVDVVVTFETIEHIDEYEKFLDEIKRVLKEDGICILSTPNDIEYEPGNHFHVHQFESEELLSLLSKRFKNVEPYYQATYKAVVLSRLETLTSENSIESRLDNFAPIEPSSTLFFYFLCSNRSIDETIPTLAALGEHYSSREENALIKKFQDAISALNNHIESLNENTDLLNEDRKVLLFQIEAYKNSRTYKAGSLVSRAKNLVLKVIPKA